MTLILPRLSSSAPIVTMGGNAAVHMVKWWNEVCTSIENAVNNIATNTAQIDQALGLANTAQSGVTNNASQISAIQEALGKSGTITSIVFMLL